MYKRKKLTSKRSENDDISSVSSWLLLLEPGRMSENFSKLSDTLSEAFCIPSMKLSGALLIKFVTFFTELLMTESNWRERGAVLNENLNVADSKASS